MGLFLGLGDGARLNKGKNVELNRHLCTMSNVKHVFLVNDKMTTGTGTARTR